MLWTGIAADARVERTAEALLAPDLFSGWGVRTMSTTCAGYNPAEYHDGTVWPHDTSLACLGLARYGHRNQAATLLSGMLAAAGHFGWRLPEVLAGFAREETRVPGALPGELLAFGLGGGGSDRRAGRGPRTRPRSDCRPPHRRRPGPGRAGPESVRHPRIGPPLDGRRQGGSGTPPGLRGLDCARPGKSMAMTASTGAASAAVRTGSMRIALVAPPWFPVPPQGYGGIESLCADLADGLVARGHQVKLFASGPHGTDAHFIRTYEDPPVERIGDPILEVTHAARAAAAIADMPIDTVHDHTLAGPLLARGRRCPTVLTVHGPVDGELGDYLEELGSTVHLVAISEAQRRSRPGLNWAATVPNALRAADYPFRRDKDDYVLFLGRMNPEKGADVAIEVAQQAGVRLLIAAKCNEPAEKAYFDEHIAPRLGPGVESLARSKAIANASCWPGRAVCSSRCSGRSRSGWS